MSHMLHLVVAIADEPFVVQGRPVPPFQKVVGFLLVVGNATELRDRSRVVQRKPVFVDQQLLVIGTVNPHMCVSVWFSHETVTQDHTVMQRCKRGGIKVTASTVNKTSCLHMVMGSALLIRVVLKKKIGMTNAERLSERREESMVWSSSYRVSANQRRGER